MHPQTANSKANGRTGSFSFNCECCDLEPDSSHPRRMREAVKRFHRDLTGCEGAYPDDETSRDFILALAVLKVPRKVARQLAPWMPQQELDAIYAKAARTPRTMGNVSEIIHLTYAQRERYGWRVKDGKRVVVGIGHFPVRDAPPGVVVPWDMEAWLKQHEEESAKRKGRRYEKQAALMAQCCDLKDETVVLAIQRIKRRPGAHDDFDWSVFNLKLTIDDMPGRAAFPQAADRYPPRDTPHRQAACRARRGQDMDQQCPPI